MIIRSKIEEKNGLFLLNNSIKKITFFVMKSRSSRPV